uniref:Uncharacterized protein n=1 Tax=Carnobacterium maltaromaticum TaxID=2751 RepID=A0A1Z5AWU0_CARML|nr:hypothetical protein [Carnobacterium maltaromaticum]CRI06550.1 conserved protein of unknown function [Carnobacterium maltaromaticum]
MRIEDHWYDGIEYYISFETNSGQTIRRNIIFTKNLTKKEIDRMVVEKFNSVKKVLNIEEVNDVLLPKSTIRMFLLSNQDFRKIVYQ